jgi:hypothetical protein
VCAFCHQVVTTARRCSCTKQRQQYFKTIMSISGDSCHGHRGQHGPVIFTHLHCVHLVLQKQLSMADIFSGAGHFAVASRSTGWAVSGPAQYVAATSSCSAQAGRCQLPQAFMLAMCRSGSLRGQHCCLPAGGLFACHFKRVERCRLCVCCRWGMVLILTAALSPV